MFGQMRCFEHEWGLRQIFLLFHQVIKSLMASNNVSSSPYNPQHQKIQTNLRRCLFHFLFACFFQVLAAASIHWFVATFRAHGREMKPPQAIWLPPSLSSRSPVRMLVSILGTQRQTRKSPCESMP